MTKKQRTILLAMLAIAGVLVIAVVGTGIWILRSLVENVSMNEAAATRSFDDVRARFGDTGPVVALRDGPVLLRRPPETQPAATGSLFQRRCAWPTLSALVRHCSLMTPCPMGTASWSGRTR